MQDKAHIPQIIHHKTRMPFREYLPAALIFYLISLRQPIPLTNQLSGRMGQRFVSMCCFLPPFLLVLVFSLPSTWALLPMADTTSSSIPPPPPISMPVWSLACPATSTSCIDNDNDDVVATTITSMNIMTFCTPVSISPKLWALSLYHDTRTKDSFLRHGKGILQLLTRKQQEHSNDNLISILGKQSGYKINKQEACREVGLVWKLIPSDVKQEDEADGLIISTADTSYTKSRAGSESNILPQHVLPACATYLEMTVQSTIDAGDHVVVICQVTRTGRWNDETDSLQWLSLEGDDTTNNCRELSKPLDAPEVLYTGWLRDQRIL